MGGLAEASPKVPATRTWIGVALLVWPALTRAEPAPTCEEAKRTNGWCEAAKVGYVASVEITSPLLYEALDAHGHTIEPSALTCETCKKALQSDGFCPKHRMGFVRGLAYLSPLTYHLARGKELNPETLACPICRSHTRGIGWCDKHQVGIVGRVALTDRKEFEALSEAYRILLTAVETAKTCEMCAAAIVAEGYCPVHRIKYKDGRPIPPPAP